MKALLKSEQHWRARTTERTEHTPIKFNKTGAEAAGVRRQSVARHLNLLLTVDVVEPVEGTSPQRYRFDPESPVSKALIQLDGAMNAAGPETGG